MNLIISGTNRKHSNSLKVAKFYQKELLKKGEEFEILSLEDLPTDIIVTDLYGRRSEAFSEIQEKISRSKKFIFVIPANGHNQNEFQVLFSYRLISACFWPIFIGSPSLVVC